MLVIHNPYVLGLLLFIPLYVVYIALGLGKTYLRFPSLALFSGMPFTVTNIFRFIPVILRILILFLFILALSRPQSANQKSTVDSTGIDMFLVLDTSGSMRALDFKDKEGKNKDRLTVVKEVAKDFVAKRAGDRLGLVVFADTAFTQVPLTLDHSVLEYFIDQLEVGMLGDTTAIGVALGIAVKRIKDIESKSKILILLTDGENTSGEITPQQAAQLAKENGVKIYTIGIGTNKGKVPYPVEGIFGNSYQMVSISLDEASLKNIASITGGRYFNATNTKELEEIYNTIDELEKTKIQVDNFTQYDEVFIRPLALALILLLIEFILNYFVIRRIL